MSEEESIEEKPTPSNHPFLRSNTKRMLWILSSALLGLVMAIFLNSREPQLENVIEGSLEFQLIATLTPFKGSFPALYKVSGSFQRLSQPHIWPFSLASLICFVLLVSLSLREISRNRFILRRFEERLSREFFTDLHRKLATEDKLSNKPTDKPSDTLKKIIRQFERLLEEKKLPSNRKNQINAVLATLKQCSIDPNNTPYILKNTKIDTTTSDTPSVLMPFFVNALLFIGIIGTFHGLIQAFSGNSIPQLIQSVQTQNANYNVYGSYLETILNGFYQAFTTSLIAYIGFLLGRLVLDLYYADREAVDRSIEERLSTDLLVVFSPIGSRVEADFMPDSRQLLEKNLRAVESAATKMEQVTDKMGGLAKSIQDSVNSFSKMNREVMLLIQRGRSDWQKASQLWKQTSDDWQTTTKNFNQTTTTFSKAASDFVSEFDKTLSTANSAIEKLNEATSTMGEKLEETVGQMAEKLKENIQGYEETLNQFTDKLNDSAKNIGEKWEEVVQRMAIELKENVNDYDKTLNRFTEKLSEQTDMIDKTRTLLGNIEEDVKWNQASLERLIREVHDKEENTRHLYLENVKNTYEQFDHQSKNVVKTLSSLQQTITTHLDSINRIETALFDQIKGEDVLSVLRELRQFAFNQPTKKRLTNAR